jgi:uncharacterized protein YoxC
MPAIDDVKEKVNDLDKKLEVLSTQNKTLQEKVAENQKELTDVEDQVEGVKNSVNDIKTKLGVLNNQFAESRVFWKWVVGILAAPVFAILGVGIVTYIDARDTGKRVGELDKRVGELESNVGKMKKAVEENLPKIVERLDAIQKNLPQK